MTGLSGKLDANGALKMVGYTFEKVSAPAALSNAIGGGSSGSGSGSSGDGGDVVGIVFAILIPLGIVAGIIACCYCECCQKCCGGGVGDKVKMVTMPGVQMAQQPAAGQ